MTLPTRTRTSFSPLPVPPITILHHRADRKVRRTTVLQPTEQKQQPQKVNWGKKKQRIISQIKEQDKTPEKQLNEVEISSLPEKEFKIMIVQMI